MAIFKKGKCSIDKKMLPMKLHYLFYSLAAASALNYFPLIAKNIGISATGLGVMFMIVPFLTVFSNPIFGFLTDKFKKIKFIIIFLVVFHTPAYFLINYIPEISHDKLIFDDIKLHFDASNTFIFINSSELLMQIPNNRSVQCGAECASDDATNRKVYNLTGEPYLNNSAILKITNITFQDDNLTISGILEMLHNCSATVCSVEENREVNYFVQYQFWLFVIASSISLIITNGIIALSDTACFESLEGRVNQFGKQRFLLSLGWGISSIATGYILQVANANNKGKTDFSVSFYIMLPLMFIDIIILKFTDMRKEKTSKNILRDVRKIFVNAHPFFLVFAVFVVGAISGLQWNYGYWHLEDLGGSKLLMGLHNAMLCIWAEVPFMFISGWIIKRIGRDNSVCMAFLAFSVWFLTASFIYNPWMILLPDIVQGPCYGLFYAAMTSYGKLIAPPGTEATMQAILGAAFHGLGIGTGSLLGGMGFDHYGGRSTYRFAGFFTLSSFVVYKGITLFIAGESSIIKEGNQEIDIEKPKIEDSNQRK